MGIWQWIVGVVAALVSSGVVTFDWTPLYDWLGTLGV